MGKPRRYTAAAAVHQRGSRMCFRTGLSVVTGNGEPTAASRMRRWVSPVLAQHRARGGTVSLRAMARVNAFA